MNESWRPSASLAALQHGARLRQLIRQWFADRNVLEVVTPALSQAAATDPQLASFAAQPLGSGRAEAIRFLHTSPEFPMKRLLACYRTDIYQICTVFRADEAGRFHNPEFTLLEWYRMDHDHRQLMQDVSCMLEYVFEALGRPWLPPLTLRYEDAIYQACQLRFDTLQVADIERCFARHDRHWPASMTDDLDAALDLLMDEFVLPGLPEDRLSFITDYPASQASLARLAPDGLTAERFEVYVGRLELANGFHELADADEQRRRFESDQASRRQAGRTVAPADEHLLSALHYGLPDCAGVALGVDRLAMLLFGADHLFDVLAFEASRA